MDILYIVSLFIGFIIGITVHECAHAWMANKLGDPTAKDLGRISLNPIRHIDLIGSLLLPFLTLISSSGIFVGWAKPTPFNPANLKEARKDELLISLAGPVSNILVSVLFIGIFYGFFVSIGVITGIFSIPTNHLPSVLYSIGVFFMYVVIENLFLAFFNLIPLPPLDGASILKIFTPRSFSQAFNFFSRYGFIILVIAARTPLGNVVSSYLEFCVKTFLGIFGLHNII